MFCGDRLSSPPGADISPQGLPLEPGFANGWRPGQPIDRLIKATQAVYPSLWCLFGTANDDIGATSLRYDLRTLFVGAACQSAIVESSRPRLCRCLHH